ncbi:MAG: hypothetical protein GYB36_01895 [Alphaproteobacteria bacterium]|nr:hypothetical protein [Alphaproteobacteria bacterium]
MSQRGHLLDDAWYMDYAAGTLRSEGEEVLLSSHLEMNSHADGRVRELERVGAAVMMMSAKDSDLPFSADMVLDRIADLEEAPTSEHAPMIPSEPFVPAALDQFLLQKNKDIHWEFLGPGLRKAMLWTGEDGEKLWLLKAQPGVAIPHHGHNGSELTLVLKGAFHDGDQCYQAGDVEEAGPETEHDIRIDEGGECICLALTRGKLRYDNPLLKAMQVFTGL